MVKNSFFRFDLELKDGTILRDIKPDHFVSRVSWPSSEYKEKLKIHSGNGFTDYNFNQVDKIHISHYHTCSGIGMFTILDWKGKSNG